MRARSWGRLSWWQKTRLVAAGTCAIAVAVAFIFVISLSGLSQTDALGTMERVALFVFPFFIVCLITLLARAQKRIDLKSDFSRAAYSNSDDNADGAP